MYARFRMSKMRCHARGWVWSIDGLDADGIWCTVQTFRWADMELATRQLNALRRSL